MYKESKMTLTRLTISVLCILSRCPTILSCRTAMTSRGLAFPSKACIVAVIIVRAQNQGIIAVHNRLPSYCFNVAKIYILLDAYTSIQNSSKRREVDFLQSVILVDDERIIEKKLLSSDDSKVGKHFF